MAGRPTSTLYPSEAEIARELLGDRARQWPEVAAVLEREGLPRIDPIMGARYFPAVRAFFDRRHGLHNNPVPSQSDGMETW